MILYRAAWKLNAVPDDNCFSGGHSEGFEDIEGAEEIVREKKSEGFAAWVETVWEEGKEEKQCIT